MVLAQELEALLQDEVLDLFIRIINNKFKDAEEAGIEARLKVMAKFDTAALYLREACLFLFDDTLPDSELRHVIFSHIPRDQLSEAADLVGQESARHAPHYYDQLASSYRSVRLFLIPFLKNIAFAGTSAGSGALEAWQFLYRLDHERPMPDLQDAPKGVVDTPDWRAVVYMQEKLMTGATTPSASCSIWLTLCSGAMSLSIPVTSGKTSDYNSCMGTPGARCGPRSARLWEERSMERKR